MAIVRMTKVSLFGMTRDKAAVLTELQRAGCMHLVNLRSSEKTKPATPEIAQDAHEALKYLQASPLQRPQATSDVGFDFPKIVGEVLELQKRDRDKQDEEDALKRAIEMSLPWGDFQLPAPGEIGGLSMWFYIMPAGREEELRSLASPWEVVHKTEKRSYVTILAEREPVGIPGSRAELDPRSLTELRRQLAIVEAELEEVRMARGGLTRWTGQVERHMALADDHANHEHAQTLTLDEGEVFAVQGWVPANEAAKVKQVAERLHLALTVEEPTEEELPPTLLKNPEFFAGGESAVTFYLMPSYRWWDPSLVVLFSFAVFFAMIISDFGYSALLGVVIAASWKTLGKTVDGRRLRHLTAILVAFSLVWGVMVGSYFGVAPPKESFLGKLAIIDTSNLNQMMLLSIIVGCIHLILANAITAWRMRHSIKGLVPVGWIISIIGGLVLGLASYEQIPTSYKLLGQIMLWVGLPMALLLNSDQPLVPTSIWHVLGRLGDGVKNLMGVSAAFGDTLSYLRLFALGLSGAQLATTFNKLAADSVQAFGAIGLVLGLIIIILGHSLNFVLGIMGGVIHGLRLNCIEFFNWCATDEGYPFRAFNKKAGT